MFTFPALVKACGKFMGISEIRQVHGLIIKRGFLNDLYIENSLLHALSVYGDYSSAWRVFDEMVVRDVVSWTSMISGYVRARLYDEALTLFLRMDVEPNIATLVSVLVVCGRRGCLSLGKGIHGMVVKRGTSENMEASNALLDMYVKCECLNEAKRLFYEIPKKDIVSWTSVISGLVQCKYPKDALELFYEMQVSGLEPDKVILTSVLSACSSLGALDYGRWVHENVDRKNIKWDVHIGTAMIDMYAKCGCIEMALQIFNKVSSKNVCTWNALIGGLAMHGHGYEALGHFENMIKAAMRPNEVTFLAILTACCHSGMVDLGRRYFYQMSQSYDLSPKLEHYGCMVDLLCRAGLLDEAFKMTKAMPMPADVSIWGALLSACKDNGNTEVSREILNNFQELESHDSGIYVLLSNIYAANEQWGDVTRVRKLIKEKKISKNPGSSIIEVDGKAHEFLVGDT
ncbi:hypothetical protein ACFE04_028764 [Oxalis oulophora]